MKSDKRKTVLLSNHGIPISFTSIDRGNKICVANFKLDASLTSKPHDIPKLTEQECISVYNELFTYNDNYNVPTDIDIQRYDFIIDEIIKNKYQKIIDISSGRGYFIEFLEERKRGIDITSTDIDKFNDLDVKFIALDLTQKDDYKKITEKYEFLSCLDVLEHIDEKYINDIFIFFKSISSNVCLSIANHSDIQCGKEIHLIQKEKVWWDDIISSHFIIINSCSEFEDTLYYYTLKSK